MHHAIRQMHHQLLLTSGGGPVCFWSDSHLCSGSSLHIQRHQNSGLIDCVSQTVDSTLSPLQRETTANNLTLLYICDTGEKKGKAMIGRIVGKTKYPLRTPNSALCTATAAAEAGATAAAGAAHKALATARPAPAPLWYTFNGFPNREEAVLSSPCDMLSHACWKPSRVSPGWGGLLRGSPLSIEYNGWVGLPPNATSACCRISWAPAARCAPKLNASREMLRTKAKAPAIANLPMDGSTLNGQSTLT